MTSRESLYYAIGEIAYAVAKADGKVQKEERLQIHDLLSRELGTRYGGPEISEIIFRVMDKSHTSVEDSYQWAIDEIRRNSHYLSPEMKKQFMRVVERVAGLYSPVTIDEKNLIDRFREDIAPLKGDPVYYDQV